MSDNRGTVETLFRQLSFLISPLLDELAPRRAQVFFAKLGIPLTPAQAASIAGPLNSVTTILVNFFTLGNSLQDAIQAGDVGNILSKSVAALAALPNALGSFNEIQSAIGGLGIPGVDASKLPGQLFDHLLAEYLSGNAGLNESLEFAGVLDCVDHNVGSVDPNKPFYTSETFHLDKLFGWLTAPGTQLRNLYDWGSPSFDGKKLFAILDKLAGELGFPAIFDPSAPKPALDLVFLDIQPKTDINPPGVLITFHERGAPTPLQWTGPMWQANLSSAFGILPGTTVAVQPNGTVTIKPPDATTLSGKVGFTYTYGAQGAGPSILLLGLPGGSRIDARQFSFSIESDFHWTGSGAVATLSAGGKLTGGNFIVDAGAGDGFIQTLLSGVHIQSSFDVGFDISAGEGVHFTGSSTLDFQIPTHISLGPIDISALTISAGIAGSAIKIAVTVDLKAALGPLTAAVQGLGIAFPVTLANNNSGNLGPLDIQPKFQPPKGAGLSVDAGIVIGGGFLSFDSDRGEYAGALELVLADFLSLAAIGLITTKMPDGSNGFSLLIIITADFGPGIQLGFGFTLLAVGGLLGLNRTMLLQPLMDGIRTNAIESIMFPKNVVANAMRIISDLRAIFPPREGTFLIGPMAKLGWGEPTLISLALGVIIEIPGNIAILGVLKLALPADDVAVIKIQVNFAGAIEFDKSRLYFFAALYDSHVLFITIEGEMGVLFAFGNDANFVVSIGGFHPQFSPPPLPFPSPRRIEVDIINESFARIRCDGYFAVTSNSVQFGSHSEFYFGFTALSVEGHSGFDALLQFSPFHFTVSISTSFSVKVFGLGVYGVGIDLLLEGPTPWHARGTASLSFLFFSVDIGIEFTWGDSRNTMLPPVALMPIVAGEFQKQSNWRAILPAGSNLLVSLRKLDPAEAAMVLHPVGTLHVSQRAIPLDFTLDKAGNQAPNDAKRFALTVASPGLSAVKTLQEQFALGQFKNLGDGAKLSQQAYSPMDSGLELSAAGNAYASGTAITCNVRYDLTIIDTKLRRFNRRFFVLAGSLFNHFLSGSSVARNPLSAYRQAQTQPFAEKIAVHPESFAVAVAASNTVFHPEAAAFSSRAAASDYLSRAVAKDPALDGALHVIPRFEVAA